MLTKITKITISTVKKHLFFLKGLRKTCLNSMWAAYYTDKETIILSFAHFLYLWFWCPSQAETALINVKWLFNQAGILANQITETKKNFNQSNWRRQTFEPNKWKKAGRQKFGRRVLKETKFKFSLMTVR